VEIPIAIVTSREIIVAALYDWAYDKYINATFPVDPDDFNPDGLGRQEGDTPNGKVAKWLKQP